MSMHFTKTRDIITTIVIWRNKAKQIFKILIVNFGKTEKALS